jgi:hypothetical protein
MHIGKELTKNMKRQINTAFNESFPQTQPGNIEMKH